MSIEKKLELLADAFDCDVTELELEKELSDFECWNSMTKLSLIVLMDDTFEKTLTSAEIKNFNTIADIIAFMD